MNLPKNVSGPLVSHIYPGEPADQAGLKPYDVILEFDHKPIQTGNDLIAAVTGVDVGTSASIKIWRKGGRDIISFSFLLPIFPKIPIFVFLFLSALLKHTFSTIFKG